MNKQSTIKVGTNIATKVRTYKITVSEDQLHYLQLASRAYGMSVSQVVQFVFNRGLSNLKSSNNLVAAVFQNLMAQRLERDWTKDQHLKTQKRRYGTSGTQLGGYRSI